MQAFLRGQSEQMVAGFGQQGLVGRDHVLARRKGAFNQALRRFDAAHEFQDDGDFRIVDQVVGIGGDRGSLGHGGVGPGFFQVADKHGLDGDLAAGAGLDHIAVVREDSGDARAHRAESGQTHHQRGKGRRAHIMLLRELFLCPATPGWCDGGFR